MTKALLIAKLGFKVKYKQTIRKITPLLTARFCGVYCIEHKYAIYVFNIIT